MIFQHTSHQKKTEKNEKMEENEKEDGMEIGENKKVQISTSNTDSRSQ